MYTGAIRLGSLNNEYRGTFVVGNSVSSDTALDYSTIYTDLVLDYFIFSSSESLKDSFFRPYIGAFVGYQFLNIDERNGVLSESISDNSLRYGVTSGFLFELGESFNLDIGTKFALNNSDISDTMYAGYIALDYKF